jgi:hypothetical protein
MGSWLSVFGGVDGVLGGRSATGNARLLVSSLVVSKKLTSHTVDASHSVRMQGDVDADNLGLASHREVGTGRYFPPRRDSEPQHPQVI